MRRLMLLLIALLVGCGSLANQPTAVDRPSPDSYAATSQTSSGLAPAAGDPRYYDIGNPTVTDRWIDPVNGDDSRSGASRSEALRTLSAAWDQIPSNSALSTGYRLLLMPGTFPEHSLPNYLELRRGSAQFPIMFVAADGRGTVTLGGDLNVFGTSYLYLIDLQIVPNPPGDAFHCEQCDHVLIRNSVLDGGNRQAHETVKINQSSHIYIEDSDIHGADDNAIDFVAVQYGHIQGNRIHDSVDWCMYAKGGSAYLRIESNELFDCGTGGFTAGQGTGFQFMTSPWLHYEAYDLKIINNVVHDTEGAGLGVNGGYNILLAYNTLYRVGSRSHVFEAVFGNRSCDGQPGDDGRERCASYLSAGGWGTTRVDDGSNSVRIPNKNVFVYNNVVYNPSGFQSQSAHFAIYQATSAPTQTGANVPVPTHTDDNLQIRGNVIWNGPSDHPLGIEDSAGCLPSNSTCNSNQLRADNTINTLEPQLTNPAGGDFRPAVGSNLLGALAFPIPAFRWADAPTSPSVPAGTLSNTVDRDRANNGRPTSSPPGAYAGPAAAQTPRAYLPLVQRITQAGRAGVRNN